MPRWLKPKLVDNWGNETVYLVPPYSKKEIEWWDRKKDAAIPRVDANGILTVKWPDGTVENVRVEMRGYSTNVSDMGNSYNVAGRRPYLTIKHHGAKFSVPLAKANVLVEWEV